MVTAKHADGGMGVIRGQVSGVSDVEMLCVRRGRRVMPGAALQNSWIAVFGVAFLGNLPASFSTHRLPEADPQRPHTHTHTS